MPLAESHEINIITPVETGKKFARKPAGVQSESRQLPFAFDCGP